MPQINRILVYFVLSIFLGAISPFLISNNSSTAQNPPIPSPTPFTGWPPTSVTPVFSQDKTLPSPQKDNSIVTSQNAREYLQVPFTVSGDIGVYTTQEYSGTVTVSISDGGQSAGIAYNDAFYLYINQDSQPITPPGYVEPFHLYIDNAPAIDTIGYLPQYRDDHIYTFYIDAGPTPRRINFSIGDLYAVDNAGSFTIALSGVQSFTITDSDEDGIWDHWETAGGGIDANGDGQIDLNLYALGARPDRKDIFLGLTQETFRERDF